MSDNNLPEYEPEEFVAGATLKWKKSLARYKAGAGWTLKYHFRNPSGSGFDAEGSASGDAWEVTVPSASTSGVAAGRIDWQAWVERDDEKYLVEEGTSGVRASLAAVTAATAFDGRTQAERDLETVRAALADNLDNLGYTLMGRAVSRYSKEDLIRLEHNLAQRVATERRAKRIRDGAPFFQTINVRLK